MKESRKLPLLRRELRPPRTTVLNQKLRPATYFTVNPQTESPNSNPNHQPPRTTLTAVTTTTNGTIQTPHCKTSSSSSSQPKHLNRTHHKILLLRFHHHRHHYNPPKQQTTTHHNHQIQTTVAATKLTTITKTATITRPTTTIVSFSPRRQLSLSHWSSRSFAISLSSSELRTLISLLAGTFSSRLSSSRKSFSLSLFRAGLPLSHRRETLSLTLGFVSPLEEKGKKKMWI